jgi:methyltransferase-like protein
MSFNVFPGWHFRASVREFIQRHVRTLEDPRKQVAEARRVVDFLASAARAGSAEQISYSDLQRVLKTASDHYVYHDFITKQNQPFYFHEFVTTLVENDLQFVTECDIRHTTGMGLSQAARAVTDTAPVFEREQLIDFVMNTCYRRSLICHAARKVTRRLDHTSMQGMHFTLGQFCDPTLFNPAEAGELTLTYDGGTMTTVEPLGKAALQFLMEIWPGAAGLETVMQAVQDRLPPHLITSASQSTSDTSLAVLGRSLLAAYAAGAVNACKTPANLSSKATEFPRASKVARHMAGIGGNVVNQWHRNLGYLAADENFVLHLLDGASSLSDIENALQTFRRKNPVSVSSTDLPRSAAQIVDAFARNAMLLGD